MSLPTNQRFKSGESARLFKMGVYDADDVLLDLNSYASATAKHRLHGNTSATTFSSYTMVASPTTHSAEIDVSSLAPGFYLIEIDIDTGSGIMSPSMEIEVYEDAG